MSFFLLLHSLFLASAVGLTAYWIHHPRLSVYTLQLIGLFSFFYLALNLLSKKQKTPSPTLDFINSLLLTLIILTLVFSTGGISSPLFFLIYFLLFGLAWSLGPWRSGFLGLVLTFFFTFSASLNFESLTAILSLLLITPLSLFFGRQFLKIKHQTGEIRILQKIKSDQQKSLAANETNVLFWLSLNFRQAMVKIIDLTSQALSQPNLPASHKEKLIQAHETAKKLLENGEFLKERVDVETD